MKRHDCNLVSTISLEDFTCRCSINVSCTWDGSHSHGMDTGDTSTDRDSLDPEFFGELTQKASS